MGHYLSCPKWIVRGEYQVIDFALLEPNELCFWSLDYSFLVFIEPRGKQMIVMFHM